MTHRRFISRALPALVAVTLLGILAPPAGADDALTFRLYEPVVLGGEVYPAGELVLHHSGVGNIIVIEINHRRVGLMSNSGWGIFRAQTRPYLVLRRDSQGVLHFDSVRFLDRRKAGDAEQIVRLRPAAMRPGLAIPHDGRPLGETIAVAQR